jgi:hypothetical protein
VGIRFLLRGLAAGAAGTTALNAVTYADMALRARAESRLPQKSVEVLAERVGVAISGSGEARQHRLDGLAALSGIVTGTGIGVVAAGFGPVLRRLPLLPAAVLVGGAAMAGTDGSMTRLGLTDPRTWSTVDWLSDVVPHFAYGIVTAWTLRSWPVAERRGVTLGR